MENQIMNGGVLIIGSLLWDPKREEWRNQQLNVNEKIHVFAPIRYGRRSRNTQSYTMVLSKDVDTKDKLGKAYVVPFNNNPLNTEQVIIHAKELSKAEGNNDEKLVKGDKVKWCIIGILFNPAIDEAKKNQLLNKFNALLEADGISNHYKDFKIGEEASVLKQNGEIDINWLTSINPELQEQFDNYDFVLATCTCQNVNQYPTSEMIKNLLNKDERDYFLNNNKNEITTFQDQEIISK